MRLAKRIPAPVMLMAAVLLAALASALVQRGVPLRLGLGRGESRPDDVVLAAFDAARRGDAPAYVSCFTGKLRTDLERARDEMGEARFRKYLRESAAAVKGIALSDRADAGEGRTRVRVETVYADKNDVQQYTLCPEGSLRVAWKVCDITGTRRARTVVPYGTEAVPLGR